MKTAFLLTPKLNLEHYDTLVLKNQEHLSNELLTQGFDTVKDTTKTQACQ